MEKDCIRAQSCCSRCAPAAGGENGVTTARPAAGGRATDPPSPRSSGRPPYPPYRRRGVGVGVGNHPPHACGDGPHHSGPPDVRSHSAVHPPQ